MARSTVESPVTITYLEMTSPGEAVPFTGGRRLDVRRVEIPSPELNRFLYLSVGGEWWWHERAGWDRERWLEWLDREEHETWVGYLKGTPAGYFELEAQPGGEVQLVYFGLLPSFIGMGLGGELLAAAVERAWQIAERRVWVHTCTLDHASALSNYQARGFKIYERIEKLERLPDRRPSFWPRPRRGPAHL